MNELHLAYLSLGSNIEPEINLVKAIQLLSEHGKVEKVSSAWESMSVGVDGPNYLNACILYAISLLQLELKERIARPIESELGRKRTADKYSPRTIDIDIVIFDNVSCADKFWEQAFVVVPLAEIYPTSRNPVTQESALKTARRLRQNFWMEARPEVLSPSIGDRSTT